MIESQRLLKRLTHLKTRLRYFNSLLHSPSDVPSVFDLSYFNDPMFFINTVKLQYAFDLDVTNIQEDWVGMVRRYFDVLSFQKKPRRLQFIHQLSTQHRN